MTDSSLLPPEPQRCPAGAGVQWLGRGFTLFGQAPLPWLAIAVVFCVVYFAASMLPGLGWLATSLLGVVFAGGIMVVCRHQVAGEGVRLSDLFTAMQQHLGGLITLGAIYLGAGMLLVVILVLCALPLVLMMGLSVDQLSQAAESGVVEPQLLLMVTLLLLIGMALYLPLAMAMWFAPALVVLDRQQPLTALTLSFSACMRNMLPFLLYGLLLVPLMLVVVMTVGIGLVVTLPVIYASTYAAYVDIFGTQAEAAVEGRIVV